MIGGRNRSSSSAPIILFVRSVAMLSSNVCSLFLYSSKVNVKLTVVLHNYRLVHYVYRMLTRSPFSIEHILTECIDFQLTRVKYYLTSDISQLFHKFHPSSILQYMKDIRLYNKL